MSASLPELLQQVIQPKIPAVRDTPDAPPPTEPVSVLLGRVIRPDWPVRVRQDPPELELPPLP
jgi:hypothetical protein